MDEQGLTRKERIEAALQARFAPQILRVIDDSARHAGHAGTKGAVGGETHFNVEMCSESFSGQSRVARARAVHEALAAELESGLHALALVLRSPAEIDHTKV